MTIDDALVVARGKGHMPLPNLHGKNYSCVGRGCVTMLKVTRGGIKGSMLTQQCAAATYQPRRFYGQYAKP